MGPGVDGVSAYGGKAETRLPVATGWRERPLTSVQAAPTPKWDSPAPTLRRWLPRVGMPALALLYVVLWGASGLQNINPTDFDVFFLPSARIALAGHPLHLYAVRYETVYPNANGPLSMVPLTLVAWVGTRLGWLDDPYLRRMLVMGAFAIFPLLMGREALLAADRLLGAQVRGVWRLLALAVVVLTPELWHSVLLYGHIEQPIMLWLTLAAVRSLAVERPTRAGVYLGLALLTRSVALLYLIPLAIVLLAHRRWGPCLRVVLTTGGVTALGLLPFWLADRGDLVYSLLTFRGGLPVGGGTFWFLTVGTPLQDVALHVDSAAVILAVVLVSVATVAIRRDLDVGSRDIYGLLALCALCFPLLMKTLWAYYFLDVYIFAALWWLLGARHLLSWQQRLRWATGLALPLAVIGVAEFTEYVFSDIFFGYWTLLWSLLIAGLVLALALAVALWLWSAPLRRRVGHAPPLLAPLARLQEV